MIDDHVNDGAEVGYDHAGFACSCRFGCAKLVLDLTGFFTQEIGQ
jgi:hypothetical protein